MQEWAHKGLIQKEKVDIDGEKSAQISIVAKKTETQRWLQIMIIQTYIIQATHYDHFVVFLLCLYYITDTIHKLELHLLAVVILLRKGKT